HAIELQLVTCGVRVVGGHRVSMKGRRARELLERTRSSAHYAKRGGAR
ncbi:MAG: hypothetical protein JWO39_1458, partial [Gemmatimonadetes bacterium]|nr:hypothetical protein [Gemmatimonadota bacterium]